METLQLLALALGLSTLAGLRLYLTVFLTSLALNQGWLHLHENFSELAILGSDAVLVISGMLLVMECLADKVPGFDSIWDSLHTLIRPIGATLLALQVLGDWPSEAKVIAALLGGSIALTIHTAKTGARLLVNTSPEPVSNLALSTAEDIAVAGFFGLLLTNPLLGGALLLACVGFAVWSMPRAFRMVKATLWLLWQRLTRFAPSTPPVDLPRHLSVDHDQLLARVLGHDVDVEWAVHTLSSRPRGHRGLKGNCFGLLVSVASEPDHLFFVAKTLFGAKAIRLPLTGCRMARDTTFLSEGLALYNRATHQRVLFRFPKAEAAIADRLAEALRPRLGDTTTPTPAASAALPTSNEPVNA